MSVAQVFYQEEANLGIINIRVRNGGQTPAYNVSYKGRYVHEEQSKIPTILDTDPPAADFEESKGVIGPSDGIRITRSIRITPTGKDRLAKNGAIVIVGRISYEDIFGETHETNFKMAAGGTFKQPFTGDMAFTKDGNTSN